MSETRHVPQAQHTEAPAVVTPAESVRPMVQTVDTGMREARTPAAIEADITRTRAHLARTLDQIADRVDPRTMARRGAHRAKSQVVSPEGGLRVGRVVMAASVMAMIVGVVALRQRSRTIGGDGMRPVRFR